MIYTIGHTESYRKALSENPSVNKKGQTETYPGGCVWRTPEEAKAFLQFAGLDNYSVYEIDADWATDTRENEDGGAWRDLLNDSKIIREIE